MRDLADAAAEVKAEHEGRWVYSPGPKGYGGVHIRWRPGVLELRCGGRAPPMRRTVRRWCEAFGVEWRPLEGWEYDGSRVTVREPEPPTGAEEE